MIKDTVSFKWKDELNVLAPQWDWEYVGNIIIKQQLLGCSTAIQDTLFSRGHGVVSTR